MNQNTNTQAIELVELTDSDLEEVEGGIAPLVLALYVFDAAILTYDLYLALK